MGVAAVIGGAAALAGAGASIYGASQAQGGQSPAGAYREISRDYLGRYWPAYKAQDLASALNLTRTEGNLQGAGALKALQNLLQMEGMVGGLEASRVSREQETVGRFAPGVIDILNSYNPQSAALLAEMASQAQTDLAAGTTLSPAEMREVQQNVRAGQASRGMGYGRNDTFDEVLTLALTGREAQDRRRRFAGDVASMSSNFYGNPFDYIFRGSGAAPYTPAGLLGVGAGTVRHVPMGPVAGNGPGGAPGNNNAANSWTALGAGLLQGGGQLIGNYLGRPQQNQWSQSGIDDYLYAANVVG